MTNEQFVKELNKILEEKSILKHPFYQKWSEGNLTMSELQEYAKQYYYFVKNFPMFVSSVHSNCHDPKIRKMLVENLADEEGFKTDINDHPNLWIQFAEALNVKSLSFENAEICDEVKDAVKSFYRLCKDEDFRVGLAALYGYEKQIPEVSQVKIEGLDKYYGINKAEEIEFFTVHRDADIHHSNAELDALLSTCWSDEDKNKVLNAVRKSASLYWQMLDGVYVN